MTWMIMTGSPDLPATLSGLCVNLSFHLVNVLRRNFQLLVHIGLCFEPFSQAGHRNSVAFCRRLITISRFFQVARIFKRYPASPYRFWSKELLAYEQCCKTHNYEHKDDGDACEGDSKIRARLGRQTGSDRRDHNFDLVRCQALSVVIVGLYDEFVLNSGIQIVDYFGLSRQGHLLSNVKFAFLSPKNAI